MKKLFFVLIAFLNLNNCFAQNATVYDIEHLPKPKNFLFEYATKDVYRFLKCNVEKSSVKEDSLVYLGEHPFLSGIVDAYKNHRPFVISPDMIWLLITQGFARHISNNAEEFRNEIVNFKNKKELTVVTKEIELGNGKSNWEAVFPQFINQISDYTGKELTGVLTADFSTTTLTTKIVSEITVMETVKAYFNYKVIIIGCGIPRITIEGTIEDWEKVLNKTKYLSKYKLGWWTTELEPIITKIIEAKKGNFDKEFWMNMVKEHSENRCGSPSTIDGWIVKFFPYTKEGKKTNFKPITNIGNLAPELVKVPFILQDEWKTHQAYKMEFWGGFIGLLQNKSNYTLTPYIGWLINNKNEFNKDYSQLKGMSEMDNLSINNIADDIPKDIYSVQKIQFLHLSFINNISISDRLSNINIGTLEITGKITEKEEKKVIQLFPKTKIIINGKEL